MQDRREETNMTFHIGQQNAGVINNIAGDQRIEGSQYGAFATRDDARRAIRELRAALAATTIGKPTAAKAQVQAADIDTELQQQRPDRSKVAATLERLVRLLGAAGSLTSASAALMGPLHTLVSWLGPLGAHILTLIPG
jgi:hypothetical protein